MEVGLTLALLVILSLMREAPVLSIVMLILWIYTVGKEMKAGRIT